jgi:cell division septation protein DedD
MVPAAAVPIADTVVHAGEATVQSMVKSATVKPTGVKPTGVKPTMEPATVKSATMEPTATVASTSAMRSVGEIWRAERSNAQHSGCGAP